MKVHCRFMRSSNTGPAMNHQTSSRKRGWGVAFCLVSMLSVSGRLQAQALAPEAAQPPAAAASNPSTDSPSATPLPAESAGPRFDVFEFEIEGNTVLSVTDVEQAVTPYLGEGKTMADVEAARATLEKTYQDRGYLTVFVDIPEQQVSQGVVQLKVLEGRVERLAVVGSRYFSQGFIRDQVPELASGAVPNFNVVQTQLAEVNRTEDRRVQPVLRPGRTPGTVEAELKVSDRAPVSGSIELNNRHPQFTTPWRLSATASYNNLFQRDHTLSMTAMLAPAHPQQSQVLALSYTVPLPGSEAWLGYLVHSNSTVSPLGAATVLGKGNIFGLRRVNTLPGTAAYTHGLTWGFDLKDLSEDTVVGSDRSATPARYVPFALAYNGTWQHSDTAQTSLSLTDAFALRSIMRRKVDCGVWGQLDQFDCKREGADGSFATLRFDVRHTRNVLGAWSAQWRAAGQITSGRLISAEQYALGGADTVRGYLESEAVGDQAVLGSFELRSPNWATRWQEGKQTSINELSAHGFVDVGRVYTISALPDQRSSQALAGLGLGLKLRAYKAYSGSLDLAWPLKTTDATPSHSPRLHARLAAEF